PAVQRQVQNGPGSEELEVQRRQMEMQQQQHIERERRSSNSGSPRRAVCSSSHCGPGPAPALRWRLCPRSPAHRAVGEGPPPPSAGAPPPPPPPLPVGGYGGHAQDDSHAPTGLAAMIAGAKLRRVQRKRVFQDDPAVKKPWDRANSAERSSLVSRVRAVGSISDADALDFDRMKQPLDMNSVESAPHNVHRSPADPAVYSCIKALVLTRLQRRGALG
ncbi:hypothetical protein cypCar_00046659, partial [Cyprinus carpio]